MRLQKHTLPVLLVLILAVSVTASDIVTDLSIGGGYQGNLFNDSLSHGESYTSAGASVKLFPTSSLQLAMRGAYNAYTTTTDLSNGTGGMAVTYIPTTAQSPVSLLLSGEIDYRGFGTLYSLYNRSSASAGGVMTVRLAPAVAIRSAISYGAVSYTNSDFGSNRGFNATGGMNFTVFGSNALALEVGYSQREYDQADSFDSAPTGNGRNTVDNTQTYTSSGVSIRYSRPFGERTGLSLSAGQRFVSIDDALAVPGYSVDYLSPWGDLWDGRSFSARLKHILPGQLTMDIGAAYYDKEFVDVLEIADDIAEEYELVSRDDRLATFGVGLTKSVQVAGGNMLTPGVRIDYSNNASTMDFYDYGDMSVSVSLGYRF